MIDKVN